MISLILRGLKMQLSISRHRYEDLDHVAHKQIHDLAKNLNAHVRYDYEFDFYKVTVSAEDWLLAKLKDPQTTDYFRIYCE
jgi:hypothetical protein